MFVSARNSYAFFAKVEHIGNDTELHTVIRSCTSIKQVKYFLSNHAKNTTSRMAKTVNDQGELPIDLVSKLKLNNQDKGFLKDLLLNFMCENDFCKLPAHLDANDFLELYGQEKNDELTRNIKIACEAINETRTIIRESSTHPDANNYSCEKRKELRFEIHNNKKKIELCLLEYIRLQLRMLQVVQPSAHSSNQSGTDMFDQLNNYMSELMIQNAYETKKGNCEDYAVVARSIVKLKYSDVSVEIYSTKQDGHVFLVIGNKINDADYRKWSKNTIICDAFLPDIFPAAQLPSKLKCWRPYKTRSSSINIIINFNPHYHLLESYFSNSIKNEVPVSEQHCQKITLSV